MPKIRLTPDRVNEFVCPPDKDQDFLWDAQTEGLGLRATARGKKYVFEAKLRDTSTGKRISIRIPIGSPRSWDLDRARKHARALRQEVDMGRDPRVVKAEMTAADVAKREQAMIEQAAAIEAWNAYIGARSDSWSPKYRAVHEQMSRVGGGLITRGRREGVGEIKRPGILRPLLELPLNQITRDRVRELIDEVARTRPPTAKLALAILGAFLGWARDSQQYRDQVHQDACERVGKGLPPAKAKDDCLQREQLKLWFEHVGKLTNPRHSAYLQILLLTGARREEVAGLRWTDVDFQWKSMAIRDKVNGTRTVPLTPYVTELLLGLQLLNNKKPDEKILKRMAARGKTWKPSVWVFSSETAASGRLQEPRIAHNKALEAAGLPSLSIHGLRRSFGTLAEWVECPAGISAQIMGHKPSALAEKHYRRRPLDLLRAWHTKIEGWILNEAGIKQPTEAAVSKPRVVSSN